MHATLTLLGRQLCQEQRHLHVALGGEDRQQVVELEDEADVARAIGRGARTRAGRAARPRRRPPPCPGDRDRRSGSATSSSPSRTGPPAREARLPRRRDRGRAAPRRVACPASIPSGRCESTRLRPCLLLLASYTYSGAVDEPRDVADDDARARGETGQHDLSFAARAP